MASKESLKNHPPLVIAIDGPAGAGKSTVAKKVAEALKISYLDTGAMYRALTLKALQCRFDLEEESSLVELAKRTRIELVNRPGGMRVLLDGKDVSDEIRTTEVTNKTFYAARAPRVREIMVQWQRAMAVKQGVVAEGRDIGTVVFPHATKKFYLDADVSERCRRRIDELKAKGVNVEEEKLTKELKERDEKDRTRTTGPLKKADDAICIDSTNMSADQVVEEILKFIPH